MKTLSSSAPGGPPFSWGSFFRWMGIVVAAILVAAILVLYFLDWNQMRGPLGRYLTHRTGRPVRIDGNLSVKLFRLQPRLDVEGLYVGNPAWIKGAGPQAGRLQHGRVEIRLLPLFVGHLVVPLVRLDKPDVLVVRDAQERTNWDGDPNAAPDRSGWKLPLVRHFIVHDGHVRIDDAVRKLHFTGTINSREDAGGKGAAFILSGDGTLNNSKFKADVRGGPLINVDAGKPYDFSADMTAGQTHVVAQGSILRPFHLNQIEARLDVTGADLSDLYYVTGLALPGTPPYHLNGRVKRNAAQYRISELSGRLGGSDLAGELTIDAGGKIPALAGRLSSRSLSFDDLGALVGGGTRAEASSSYLLPDTVLHTERLRQMNAEVDYSAAAVRSRDFPITFLNTHISLEGGVLKLKPVAFGFTQGKLSGALTIDARKDVPVTDVDARITDIHAETFIPGSDKPLQGLVEARARLTGRGASVHRAASNADGAFTAVIPGGTMRHSLAEWTGVDVLSALGLTLAGDKSNTRLRCALADFSVKNGLLDTRHLVIDTDPVRIDGGGSLSLRDETIAMHIQGKPKSFQFVRLRAPITITGKLAHPSLGIDAGPAIAQGGLGAALGLLSPLASVLAFIDPGLAKDANCRPLLETAQARGAPVKASAVRNAAPVRK